MTGIKTLRYIQLGVETTAGTAVAATTIWRGLGTIEDQREVVFAEEDVAVIGGVDRTYVSKLEAELVMEPVPATFEQLPYILEAGVKTATTAADGTSSSGVLYTYTFPTTAKNTIKTYTLEGGDDQQEEEVEYAFVQDFALEGAAGQAVMMGATWKGRQVTASTKTGALSIPTVEEILFQKASLYIDAGGGTIGSTQKSNTLVGFKLEVTTGWKPVWAADGNLYFSFAKVTDDEILLNVTFEHDGTATAEKTAWRNETVRLIRLDIPGSALTTTGSGTTFSGTKGLRIDLAGKWEKFDKLAEQDGNDIVTGRLRARYSSADALKAEIKVVNELAALP